jgi:predicted 3-demethylubiquinone-9 3-methyltransferase (glyoxalase superfamily)
MFNKETVMQKMMPCLWFDTQGEEAARFYISIFKDSKIIGVTHYGDAAAEGAHMPKDSVMTVLFELNGQEFMALNGGPTFTFSPAISIVVKGKTQEELDDIGDNLPAEGEEVECGWLTDKYGISWQIVPAVIGEMMASGDPEKTDRVMKALMEMKKLDIAELRRAWEGG